jgi:hypothetical protein
MEGIKYNLIGISGHKNSGKDLVANMIQYLTSSYYPKMEFLQYLKENKQSVTDSSFCIKRFADKLKDIVCILLGCTREQLEDRDFKEKELPEEWWCWKVYLDTKYYYHDYELVPFTGELDVYKQLHESPENFFGHELVKLTPRLLLQLLGTDCGRNIIHPNIWVNALFVNYPSDELIKQLNSKTDGSYGIRQPNYIIPDVRFPNEVKAIKKRGGIVIRVNRSGFEDNDIHPSEIALDNYQYFDYIINNDSDILSLLEKVKEFLYDGQDTKSNSK